MQSKFRFGIYPGGEAGSDEGVVIGPADDPAAIERALDELEGDGEPLVVRVYERYSDAATPSKYRRETPANYLRYAHGGRKLDLVAMFQSASGDVEGFCAMLRGMVCEFGGRIYSLQVTEEASFRHGPDCIDGPWPRVLEGLVEGVKEAKGEARRMGLEDLLVGFNSTPTFGETAGFWAEIGALGGVEFAGAVDYVGLDFFPDVFRPAEDVRTAALGVIETMRNVWMPAAGLGAEVPIHIAEHGWPTGPERTEARQAEVMETVVRLALAERERLNLRRYTLFGLRDAESFRPETAGDIFQHFGVMRSDYSAKAGFAAYKRLMAEAGKAN